MTPPPDDGPDWVRDGVRQFADELSAYARTVADFTRHPFRFGQRWTQANAAHALNPLGFLATALAILGGAKTLFSALVNRDAGPDAAESLAHAIAAALLPFVYYVLLATLAHGALRLLGSPRRWRDSCAMALYAGGGPALLAELVALVLAYLDFRMTGTIDTHHGKAGLLLTVSIVAAFSVYCMTLGASLRGLHAVSAWKPVVALASALVASAFLFGWLQPPGHYGLHPVFRFQLTGQVRSYDIALSD